MMIDGALFYLYLDYRTYISTAAKQVNILFNYFVLFIY